MLVWGGKHWGSSDDSKHTCRQLISHQEVPLVSQHTFKIKVLNPNNKKTLSCGNTIVLIQQHKNKMRDKNTVKHGIRLKRTIAYYFPAQSSVSTSGTAGVDTSTVMLLQYTKHTMLWLPSWLSVLPMLCIALSAAVYLNAAIMTAQSVQGRDRPVKVERHTLMKALQQDELSSGLQQQDAIWLKSRQLPVINSIPSGSPQAV